MDISELTEYNSEDEEQAATTSDGKKESTKTDDTYTALHSSGFREFYLKPELQRAIADCGFEHPSEVQHECIPQAVLGNDVLCQAKSGMGKTAVFVLATLQQLDPVPGQVQCVVMCHTRELAYQIAHEYERFKKYIPGVKVGVFYGGVPIQQNRDLLSSDTPNIVIGTPGRMKQLVVEKALDLTHCKHFILDECDNLLREEDMRDQVQNVFVATPHSKQVMMFTATLDEKMRGICKMFMHDPLEIIINDGSKLTLHGLKQFVVQLEPSAKDKKLVELLDSLDFNQVVIFAKSVTTVNKLNKLLQECNFPSICIHSRMEQPERIERYRKFKDFQRRIMVATDIFGRGIDIERVNVVFNYDMPDSADTYLHRVGRAGRFGTKGLAISFVSSEDDARVLNDVQSRFAVEVPALPDKVDPALYMTGS